MPDPFACERKRCGHPMNLHNPCSVAGCRCKAFTPEDRRLRMAMLTDTVGPVPTLADVMATLRGDAK